MLGNLPVNLVNHRRTVFKRQVDLILMYLICVTFFNAKSLVFFGVCTEGNGVKNQSVIIHAQALLLRKGPSLGCGEGEHMSHFEQ